MLILSTLFMVIGLAAFCISAMLLQMARERKPQPERQAPIVIRVLKPGDWS